jgi:hypothetical protein
MVGLSFDDPEDEQTRMSPLPIEIESLHNYLFKTPSPTQDRWPPRYSADLFESYLVDLDTWDGSPPSLNESSFHVHNLGEYLKMEHRPQDRFYRVANYKRDVDNVKRSTTHITSFQINLTDAIQFDHVFQSILNTLINNSLQDAVFLPVTGISMLLITPDDRKHRSPTREIDSQLAARLMYQMAAKTYERPKIINGYHTLRVKLFSTTSDIWHRDVFEHNAYIPE